jgi:hypothetical protein
VPALHGEQPVQRGSDDLVLLGLDGCDDVEHPARAGALELGQQRIAAAQAGGAGIAVGAIEQVVCHRDDGMTIDHDLAAAGEAHRMLGTGPVEGHGHGSPPVHDDGIGTGVLDVAAADVPRGAVLLVDTPEKERPWAVGQERHPPGEGGDVVEIGTPSPDELLEQLLRPHAHGGEGIVRVLQVGLLRLDLGIGEWRRCAHRRRVPAKSIAIASAQKYPDIPGTVLNFTRPNKASTCSYPFSSVRTLNLYPRGLDSGHFSKIQASDQASFHDVQIVVPRWPPAEPPDVPSRGRPDFHPEHVAGPRPKTQRSHGNHHAAFADRWPDPARRQHSAARSSPRPCGTEKSRGSAIG